MSAWSRSVVVLAIAFAGTVAITLALIALIVQDRAISLAEASQMPLPTVDVGSMPTRTGASLAVTGDRDAAFSLDRDEYDVSIEPDFERGFARVELGRYSLSGDGARIHFSQEPLAIEQIDLESLAFYPEPEACTITPGELNSSIGVASAGLLCADLTDIRETATVTIEGGVALPADMLGLRGDLPPAGGEIAIGDQTLVFSDGRILVQDVLNEETQRQPLFLYADDNVSSIAFERDPETGQLILTHLVVNEELFEVSDDECDVSATELGPLNPITTVNELSIECDQLDLGDHGSVSIDATLVIDLILESETVAARP